MIRSTLRAALGFALLLAAPIASAQTPAAGTPSPGVEVQHRYSNPSDSRAVLNAQPTAPADASGTTGTSTGGAMQIDGDAVGPLVNTRVGGIQEGGGYGDQWVDADLVYTGVIPGARDSLPHISRTQRHGADGRRNTLTWIGFQPLEGTTRVFIQTGRPAQYQVVESPDGLTLTVRLRDTTIELSNFRRWIDASYFGRAVSRIDAARGGDGVTEVTIDLSRTAAYTVEGAGEYLYVDFQE